MADPVTPAAPAIVPAAPAATPTSLVPDVAATPPAAVVPPATPPAAVPPVTPPAAPSPDEWFLSDGVKGTGAKPDWYKSDKYKSVGEQAKAYTNLEKRLGSFTGAPEGEYVVKVPDQFKDVVQIDSTNPLFGKLNKLARDSQMNQAGYDGIIGLLAEYEASTFVPPPTVEDAKKAIGANADTRLDAVSKWAKANLDEPGLKSLQAALSTSNPAIGETLSVIEAAIAKSRQVAPPTPPPAPVGNPLAEIDKLQAQIDPKTGKRLYEISSEHRALVEKKRREFYAAQAA